jgi:hypothetical protein
MIPVMEQLAFLGLAWVLLVWMYYLQVLSFIIGTHYMLDLSVEYFPKKAKSALPPSS